MVRKERPELEKKKDELVVNIAQSNKKLLDLEDEILRYSIVIYIYTIALKSLLLPLLHVHVYVAFMNKCCIHVI